MTTLIAKRTIASEAAFKAVGAAIDKGLEMGCRVSVAVVDAGGNLMAFRRADGAYLHSTGLAQDKAYTAAGFGAPTGHVQHAVKDSAVLRDTLVLRDRLVLLAGGLPIAADGEVAGAIGCSGGTEEQDVACALAGLAAIGLNQIGGNPNG